MSRRLPSAILLGLLHGSGLVSDYQIEKIADKIFGNVDLSVKENRVPSAATQEQLIAKAAEKRARKAAARLR